MRTDGEGVAVVTDAGVLRADRVVVASDAWTNQVLAGTGTALPLTVLREQVTYYATPHLAEFAPSAFPVFMWHGHHNFYGFPVYGEVATKLGQHMGGNETTADDRTFDPDPVRRERYAEFVDRHIPRFGGPELYSRTCLYTVPPDQNFVLDTLPGSPADRGRDRCRARLQVRRADRAAARRPRAGTARRRIRSTRSRSPARP